MRAFTLSLSLSITALALSVFLLAPLAAQASPWPYAPGATTDPACAPTDPTCIVSSVTATGSVGQVPYYAAAGNILSATSTITILQNGSVGIGTTTPGSLFSLGGIANFTTATSTFYGSGGVNLAAGCFAVNGICVSSGSGTVSSGTTGQIPFYASNGTTLTATSSLALSPSGSIQTPNITIVGADPSYSASTNTAAIQSALNLGGLVTLANPGVYQINSTLSIPSNTNFTCGPGVTIKLANGSNTNMLTNTQYGSATTSVTSLTSTDGMVVTATTASPHGLNVGDYVFITGAQSKVAQQGTTTIQTANNRITGLASTQGMFVGDPIYGVGIPNGSFITNIVNNTSVDISQKLSGGMVNTLVTTLDNSMEPYNGIYKVTSVPSPTQFTYRIADAAPSEPFPTTATGTIVEAKADHDITINGCTWDYNMINQSNADQLSANLMNIRRVANLKVLHNNLFNIGLYGVGIYNIYGGLIEDIYGVGNDTVVLGASRNLVQLTGSGRDVTFRDIRGRFNDNLAAVVQGDYPQHIDSGFVVGNFDNILVDGITSDRSLTAFNYITKQGYMNGNVTVRNVIGSFSGGSGFINTGGDTGIGAPIGNIYRFTVDGVENQQFAAKPTIQLNGIFYASVSNSSAALGGGVNTSNFIYGGSDYSITTTHNQVSATSTQASYLYPAGQIMYESHSNINVTGIGNGILSGNNSVSPLAQTISISNWTGNASGSVLNIQANNTTANLSNVVDTNFSANMINVAAGVTGVVINGQNIGVTPTYQFTVGSGAGVEVNGSTFGQDLGAYGASPPAWLSPATGDLMKNTNASGTGLYSYTSSGKWANIANPSIYNFGTNVGIGTTSPYARFEVWGPDSGATTTAFAVVNSASTTAFSVYDNGNATYSGSIFQSSDRRLKTSVTPLEASSSLSAIMGLNPVSYTRIDQPTGGTNLGFLAQDVQQIFPELVSTTSPTTLTPNGTLTLNYIGLIAPIVEAIKELAGEVSSLVATVAGFAQSFTSQNITASQHLCIGSTCVTESQLKSLLQNSAPQSGSTITITDVPAPSCTLSASPTSVTPGDHVVLSWSFPDAGTFSIDQNIGSVSPALSGTTTSKAIDADTTFTGTGVSSVGGVVTTCTASVSVTSAPPVPPPLDPATSTPPVPTADTATSTATSTLPEASSTPPTDTSATSNDTAATSTASTTSSNN
ncbi:MAG: tail fiber domain-containing protein [Minisyncoccota bacterium]